MYTVIDCTLILDNCFILYGFNEKKSSDRDDVGDDDAGDDDDEDHDGDAAEDAAAAPLVGGGAAGPLPPLPAAAVAAFKREEVAAPLRARGLHTTFREQSVTDDYIIKSDKLPPVQMTREIDIETYNSNSQAMACQQSQYFTTNNTQRLEHESKQTKVHQPGEGARPE